MIWWKLWRKSGKKSAAESAVRSAARLLLAHAEPGCGCFRKPSVWPLAVSLSTSAFNRHFQSRLRRQRRRAKAVLESKRWLKVNDGWKSNEKVSAATIPYQQCSSTRGPWFKLAACWGAGAELNNENNCKIEIMLMNSIINLKINNENN